MAGQLPGSDPPRSPRDQVLAGRRRLVACGGRSTGSRPGRRRHAGARRDRNRTVAAPPQGQRAKLRRKEATEEAAQEATCKKASGQEASGKKEKAGTKSQAGEEAQTPLNAPVLTADRALTRFARIDRVQIGLSPRAERDAMHRPMLESQGRGMPPKRPVVGVIGSAHTVEGKFTAQRVGERNLRAVADTAGALPLMFAGTPEITDIGALLDTVDGILLTGARANVHPSHFGHDEHPAHEPYDRGRDAIALKLIAACVERV